MGWRRSQPLLGCLEWPLVSSLPDLPPRLDHYIIDPIFLQQSSWLMQQWNNWTNIRWPHLPIWESPLYFFFNLVRDAQRHSSHFQTIWRLLLLECTLVVLIRKLAFTYALKVLSPNRVSRSRPRFFCNSIDRASLTPTVWCTCDWMLWVVYIRLPCLSSVNHSHISRCEPGVWCVQLVFWDAVLWSSTTTYCRAMVFGPLVTYYPLRADSARCSSSIQGSMEEV